MIRETSLRPMTLRHPDPWGPEVVAAIQQHAMEAYPMEACGIITDDVYVRCENIHEEPLTAFRINPEITSPLLMEGKLQAVVHSHPDGPNHPTYEDLASQIDMDVTWGVVPVIGDERAATAVSDILWWGDQLPPVPLERRRFVWGIFHCYQLYRDWWWQERGVRMPVWPLGPDFIQQRQNVFENEEYREKAGLTNLGKPDICDLQVGDMLLGKLRGDFPTHCGIFVGGDLMLHHPPGGSSGKTELLRWWPRVDMVYRYDDSSDVASIRRPSQAIRKSAPRRRRKH
jgi:proteasome lid subunit RPN8/RPN11